MKSVRVTVKRTGAELAKEALVADTFGARCKGLLGKRLFLAGEGLIINPCKMVHMMFMTFAIDVVFCDSQNVVISFQENLKPWKLSRHESRASYVIELPAGMCRNAGVEAGDEVLFSS